MVIIGVDMVILASLIMVNYNSNNLFQIPTKE